jgi:hypothetical protein
MELRIHSTGRGKLSIVQIETEMSRRRRSNDIAKPIAQLALLIMVLLVFVPSSRVYLLMAGVIGLCIAGCVMAYRLKSGPRAGSDSTKYCLDASTSAPTVPPAATSHRVRQTGILDQLRTIDWFQFEKVIAAVYQNLGYTVTRRGGANPDGGIDLILLNADGQIAVQCKQWRSWKVRERTVREFIGAMTHARIPKGIIVTLCGYTDEARRLADAHGIELLAEQGLANLLDKSHARYNPEVLAAINDTRKICPKCEAEMVLRTSHRGDNAGARFWGCSGYPKCRFTMPLAANEV